MNGNAWIAIVSIAVASGFSLLGLVIQGLLAAFHFGKVSERLAAVEEKTSDVAHNNSALAVLSATVSGIDTRLTEVAADVKNLLTGRLSHSDRR